MASVKVKKKKFLTDVIFAPQKRAVWLREKAWKIELTPSDLRDFLKKNRYWVSGIAICLVLITAAIGYLSVGKANIVNLYPTACLGGWENPQNAEGEPQAGATEDFNENNSAVLQKNKIAQIYCGGFRGDIPENSVTGKFIVKFSLLATDQERMSDAEAPLPEIPITDPQFQSPDLDPGAVAATTSENDLILPTETPAGEEVVPVTESPIFSPEASSTDVTPSISPESAITPEVTPVIIPEISPVASPDETPEIPSDVPEITAAVSPELVITPAAPTENNPNVISKIKTGSSSRISFWRKILGLLFGESESDSDSVIAVESPEPTVNDTQPSAGPEATLSPSETPASSPSEEIVPTETSAVDAPAVSPSADTENSPPGGADDTASGSDDEGVEAVPVVDTSSPDATAVPAEIEEAPFESEVSEPAGTSTDEAVSETVQTETPTETTTSTSTGFAISNPSSDGAFLEIYYTLDGSTWQSLGYVNRDNWKDLTLEIPGLTLADLANFQISVQSLPAVDAAPVVYLDGLWLETTVVTPEPTAIETPQPTPQATVESREEILRREALPEESDIVSTSAGHSCEIEPFSQTIKIGEAAHYTISLKPSEAYRYFELKRGGLPLGVKAVWGQRQGMAPADVSLTLEAGEEAQRGSFSLIVIHKEKGDYGEILNNFCQYNLVIE